MRIEFRFRVFFSLLLPGYCDVGAFSPRSPRALPPLWRRASRFPRLAFRHVMISVGEAGWQFNWLKFSLEKPLEFWLEFPLDSTEEKGPF